MDDNCRNISHPCFSWLLHLVNPSRARFVPKLHMLAVFRDLGMVPRCSQMFLIRPVMANKVDTLVWFSWCIIITVPICTNYQFAVGFGFASLNSKKNIACFSHIIYLVRFPTSNNLSRWYPMITSHTISPYFSFVEISRMERVSYV